MVRASKVGFTGFILLQTRNAGSVRGWWRCASCLRLRSFAPNLPMWFTKLKLLQTYSVHRQLNLQPPQSWLHLILRFYSAKTAKFLCWDCIVFCHKSEIVLGSNGINFYPESLFEERLINFTDETKRGRLQTPHLIMMVGKESGPFLINNKPIYHTGGLLKPKP